MHFQSFNETKNYTSHIRFGDSDRRAFLIAGLISSLSYQVWLDFIKIPKFFYKK